MKKLTKNSRSAEQERRDDNSDSTIDTMERRKRPDRRLTGWDVSVVDVTETAFMNFVHQFIPKK